MAKARIVTGGQLLAELLKERGLSQLALEQRLDVGRGAVSRWISGQRMPTLEMAFRIEVELGLDASVWRSSSAA